MNKSTANIKLIKEGEFDAEVVQSSLPVVVDFYATWCGPCKILSPRLDELAGPLTKKNQIRQNQRGRGSSVGTTPGDSRFADAGLFQEGQGSG